VKNLIVKADDLGWTDGVNRGIVESFHRGIVTSASLMANGAALAGAVEAVHSALALGVGVHLNLSDGPPVADRETVTSLLNDDGEFAGGPESLLLRRARRGLLLAEVENEWDAQIQKVRDAGSRRRTSTGINMCTCCRGYLKLRCGLRSGMASEQFGFRWRHRACTKLFPRAQNGTPA
jgi:predicted glycoside hydrolase/deacetylase ChbG (UPF0249 family)